MRRFVPRGATLYVGSTEAAPFFSPLAGVWNLLFASNFSEPLRGVSNNYALYAIESLLFVGADVYMETFGYTRGNFMRSYIRRARQFEPMIEDSLQREIVDAYVSMQRCFFLVTSYGKQ